MKATKLCTKRRGLGSELWVNGMSMQCVLRTFFDDAAPVVQHALHLAAAHVRQARLLHEGLAPVEARAVGQVGPHRDQKANVVLAQPCMGLGGRGETERQVRREKMKKRDLQGTKCAGRETERLWRCELMVQAGGAEKRRRWGGGDK